MILNQILENINKCPEAPALVFEDRSFTYAELGEKISEICFLLKDCQQEAIGVLAHHDFLTYASILAILLSGNTFVPMMDHESGDRNKAVMKAAGLKKILCENASSAEKKYHGTGIQFLDAANVRGKQTPSGLWAEQIAYILFTSGSTGEPKGVPITVKNLESFFAAHGKLGLKLNNTDRFLQMFDFTFDLSVVSYLLPLTLGAAVHELKSAPSRYLAVYKTLKESKITYALMVPSIVNFLKPYLSTVLLPELRYSNFCGEALREADFNLWKSSCPNAEFWNFYGPTEATIYCSGFACESIKSQDGIISIGKPLEGTKFQVTEEGELCISGPQVTEGYLAKEANQNAFITINGERYYKTGDMVTKDADGDFFYKGRTDQQVKLQGFRLELGDIENTVLKLTNANSVAVTAIDTHGNRVLAIYVETEFQNEKELLTNLAKALPSHALPKKIFFLNLFPLNINGKIDRKKLAQQFEDFLRLNEK